jgi:hypothetical protein
VEPGAEPRGNGRMRCALVLVSALVLTAGAAAKDGVRATLTSPIDVKASPGATVHVTGTLADRDGHPFGAGSLFVRLLGRSGGSTFAFARSFVGRFSADVAVPQDGFGGIRVGIRGQACGPSGCRVADGYFPVLNSPFRTKSGVVCDATAVAGALRAFAAAFSAGDLRRLDALFAHDSFGWYSSGPPGERFTPDAQKRETLIRYFAARHRQHDRIRLVSYRFNGYEKLRVIGHFELTFARRAGDYREGEEFESVGKGAIDCSSSPIRFMVLSLGGP